jgi:hypothetical protein
MMAFDSRLETVWTSLQGRVPLLIGSKTAEWALTLVRLKKLRRAGTKGDVALMSFNRMLAMNARSWPRHSTRNPHQVTKAPFGQKFTKTVTSCATFRTTTVLVPALSATDPPILTDPHWPN